jgi:hypothetical protein
MEGEAGLTANPEAGYAQLLALAEAGHGTSMVHVATALLDGWGVAKNVALGVEWLRKAEEAKVAVAFHIHGVLIDGVLVNEADPDFKKTAWPLLLKAADLGCHPAMTVVAQTLAQGIK